MGEDPCSTPQCTLEPISEQVSNPKFPPLPPFSPHRNRFLTDPIHLFLVVYYQSRVPRPPTLIDYPNRLPTCRRNSTQAGDLKGYYPDNVLKAFPKRRFCDFDGKRLAVMLGYR